MEAIIKPYDRGTYIVRSKADPSQSYIVDYNAGTCSCPRGMHTPHGLSTNCWHMREVQKALQSGTLRSALL